MSTRSINHTGFGNIVRFVTVVMILLAAAGCGKSEPTAKPVPPTHTPLPPTAEPTMTLPTPTTLGGGGGQIAFDTSRYGNLEVYSMFFDGSNETNLTNRREADLNPAWSPSGDKIAFEAYRDGNAEIYVMNADGSDQKRLTNHLGDDASPIWSPDGSRIVFYSKRDGNAEIYVMNADGSEQKPLTNDPADDSYPVWSPDGDQIAFTTNRDGDNEIYVMDADGENLINLTNNDAADWLPAWSPDGTQILFSSKRDGNYEIYVMDADGRNPTRLTHDPASDYSPTWATDGRQIVFGSDRAGKSDIYVMNADGSDQKKLTNNAFDNYSPDWKPPTTTVATPTPTSRPTVQTLAPEMILVEAGDFQMGLADGNADEGPVHAVRITRPFYITRYEITFELYDQFCTDVGKSKPREDKKWGIRRGPDYPVCVKWADAIAFCNWLSEKEGLTPCYTGKGRLTQCDFSADGYRLPTEAEWEYAARGGQKSQGYMYAGGDDPDAVGWYGANSGNQTQPVGQKQPNELGLYDMSGNAWEWCWDWYKETVYASSPVEDPTGPMAGTERVRRSGSWLENPGPLRITYRSFDTPTMAMTGMRLVRTKPASETSTPPGTNATPLSAKEGHVLPRES